MDRSKTKVRLCRTWGFRGDGHIYWRLGSPRSSPKVRCQNAPGPKGGSSELLIEGGINFRYLRSRQKMRLSPGTRVGKSEPVLQHPVSAHVSQVGIFFFFFFFLLPEERVTSPTCFPRDRAGAPEVRFKPDPTARERKNKVIYGNLPPVPGTRGTGIATVFSGAEARESFLDWVGRGSSFHAKLWGYVRASVPRAARVPRGQFMFIGGDGT